MTRLRRPALLASIVAAVAVAAMASGQSSPEADRTASAAGATASAGTLHIATKTTTMTRVNHGERRVVLCPGDMWPYGGGMSSKPPAPDGEGVYPHSYERLGQQGGWHISPVLMDPSPRKTANRTVTLQVACGRRLRHVTPPHVTEYVKPGQETTLVAKCPGRRHLMGGGFQRTDFNASGGVVATEVRAISSRAWRVSGRAYGNFGGELTAIAYCLRAKKPLLRTVSDSVYIPRGEYRTARTRRCPGTRKLVFGGWATPRSQQIFATNGSFKKDGSWATSGYNRGPGAKLTAYGYCLKV